MLTDLPKLAPAQPHWVGHRRDHRCENADRKRSETRARILGAALAACAGNLNHLPSVEDIVERARLSRGTFYKYFDSMEEVLAALGQDLTQLALLEGERFRGVFSEKWKSTSVVLRMVLTRSLLDPAWASFVVRTRGWVRADLLALVVRQDLAEGRASGEYKILDDEVALDILRGLLESCITALQKGVASPETYIDGAVHMWLQALGVEPQRCLEGVQMSRQFLSGYLSGELAPFALEPKT